MTTKTLEPPTEPRKAADETTMRRRVLSISTAGFTLLFAVWLMFGVLAIPIRAELHLSEMQFSWLTAIAILNGSIWRLPLGILADRMGGRRVMIALLLATVVPTVLVAFAHSYVMFLLLAFFVGMAGNGFSIGVAWNSAWFPRQSQGFALGMFGAGNIGASATKFLGPAMIALIPAAGFAGGWIPGGWRFVPLLYAAMLLGMAALTWRITPQDRRPGQGRTVRELLRPLACSRVWRFSLYYVVMFGAYVALSVWLPRYYEDVYHLPLVSAALLTALFIFPASLLRPVGGYLSDRIGARVVMYGVFTLMLLAAALLSIPNCVITLAGAGAGRADHSLHVGSGVATFTALIILLGVSMGVGKAAVYKYIPEYFPRDVGAVGGLVGALGGLGGFFLPPVFAWSEKFTGVPQATFMVLLAVTAISFLWLHVTVLRLNRRAAPRAVNHFERVPQTALATVATQA